MKMINDKISDFACLLKSITENNITEEYVSWLNDKEVNKFLDTKSATLESQKEYVRKQNKDKNIIFLGIYAIQESHIDLPPSTQNYKLIGTLKYDLKESIVSIMIGDKTYWNKGYGSKAIKLFVEYIKKKYPQVREIKAGVIKKNIGSIRMFEKCGFKITKDKQGHSWWMKYGYI
jgi:RimJ/RimL family protein N-acetyltransferase